MANIDTAQKLQVAPIINPVSIAASLNPAASYTMYEYDLTSGPYTLTLPTGTTAEQIGVLCKNGTGSLTKYLDVVAGSGTIRGAADTYRFRTANFSAMFYREGGSSDWQIDFNSANFNLTPTPGLVKGASNGVPIAPGYRGERVTWATPPVTQTLGASLVNWTNAFFTVTPGVWIISASVCVEVRSGSAVNNTRAARVMVTESDGTLLQFLDNRTLISTPAAAETKVVYNMPFYAVVTVNSTKVYKLMVQRGNFTGTGTAEVRNASGDASEFFAVRIA